MTNRRKGFTLVELLVVIAIIAVLMAILIPSLNMARLQAKNTACQSNLRQIGISCFMYVNDNDQWLPHNGGYGTWSYVYMNYAYSEMSSSTWSYKVWSLTNRNRKFLNCPQLYPQITPNHYAQVADPNPDTSPVQNLISTYGLNEWMGGVRLPDSNPQPSYYVPYKALRPSRLSAGVWWIADGSIAGTSWSSSAPDGYQFAPNTTTRNLTADPGNAVWPWSVWWRTKFVNHPNDKTNFLMGDMHVEGVAYLEYGKWSAKRKQDFSMAPW